MSKRVANQQTPHVRRAVRNCRCRQCVANRLLDKLAERDARVAALFDQIFRYASIQNVRVGSDAVPELTNRLNGGSR